MWYHSVIVSLMQPWVDKQTVFRSFTSAGSTRQAITAASLRQLKRLMIELRLHYPLAPCNSNWHPCLMYIANEALAESERDLEWQFYFMAALSGYSILAPAFRLGEIVFRALLTMAVDKGKFPAAKARKLFRENARRSAHHHFADSVPGTTLDFSVESSQGKTNTAGDLAARFESMVSLNTEDEEVRPVDEDRNDSEAADVFDEFINPYGEGSSGGYALGENPDELGAL